MKVLLLSCSTGEGHNHCALAVKEALDRRGHETQFLDMLSLFGEPWPINIETVLNTISSKAPDMFGLIYKAGEMFSSTNVTSPVYVANIRHARQLNEFIGRNSYDAVVCSHLFPMETLTFIRRHYAINAKCYGLLSDYACIPFFKETQLDMYMLPHEDVKKECVQAGMEGKTLAVTGMPVSNAFERRLDKDQSRKELGLPLDKKIYLIMTGGIGCGDAIGLCQSILRVPSKNSLICVLAGRNQTLIDAVKQKFSNEKVLAVPFTDKVVSYMSSADVLLSKAGGISSSEAVIYSVPLVHTMAIPGVETLNAQFFAKFGMSFFARSEDEAARFADRLIYDGETARAMLAAQKTGIPRNGAENIAELIERGQN